MPSLTLGYVAGSGFTPLVSGGNYWSGRAGPVGGVQLVAAPSNSGNVYVSLSGGNAFSGQAGTLVGSGGPTINSGGAPLSGLGAMDGMVLPPGGAYFVPRLGLSATGPTSGSLPVCLGCDLTCSGQARVYFEPL